MANQKVTVADLIAAARAKGMEVSEGVSVKRAQGISKKTGKPYSGFHIKVGDTFPLYVTDRQAAALAGDEMQAALKQAIKDAKAQPKTEAAI